MIKNELLIRLSILRRALGGALAVVVAVFCERYYGQAHYLLIPAVAIFIIQFRLYANVNQAFQLFLATIVAIFIFLAITWLSPQHLDIYVFMHDAIFGGLIGIAARVLFFIDALAGDFRQRIVVVLRAYSDYLGAIGNLLLREPDAAAVCERKKVKVENILLAKFPDWVYQHGFNPVMQQGHRHFLVRVEKLGETLFAMNFAARQPIDADLIEDFREPILQAIAGAKEIMAAMITRLLTEKFEKPVTDLVSEIIELEKTFRLIIDIPYELLDSSKNALVLSAFIYDLKDLRMNLIKIAEALR